MKAWSYQAEYSLPAGARTTNSLKSEVKAAIFW
jgi:hypothetical protein